MHIDNESATNEMGEWWNIYTYADEERFRFFMCGVFLAYLYINYK